MLTINLVIIFVFGLAISGIVFKGTLLAQEYKEKEERYEDYVQHRRPVKRF